MGTATRLRAGGRLPFGQNQSMCQILTGIARKNVLTAIDLTKICLQSPKTSDSEVKQLARSCFRLNSLQMAALLSQDKIPNSLMDTAISMAESVADELTRSDGREICLEESPDLALPLLIPDDGFSCDVVRGIPTGLVDFVSHLQAAGMCRLAAQPTSIGLWTVYMHQYNVNP